MNVFNSNKFNALEFSLTFFQYITQMFNLNILGLCSVFLGVYYFITYF